MTFKGQTRNLTLFSVNQFCIPPIQIFILKTKASVADLISCSPFKNKLYNLQPSVEFSSVAQSCPTLCDPMNRSTPGLPVYHQLPLMSIESMMPSSHLIFCRPLLLLPPIPPSIRVFSNESTLLMRWPKYWSFSFNISPSNEHSGLISFRMDWLDLLGV